MRHWFRGLLSRLRSKRTAPSTHLSDVAEHAPLPLDTAPNAAATVPPTQEPPARERPTHEPRHTEHHQSATAPASVPGPAPSLDPAPAAPESIPPHDEDLKPVPEPTAAEPPRHPRDVTPPVEAPAPEDEEASEVLLVDVAAMPHLHASLRRRLDEARPSSAPVAPHASTWPPGMTEELGRRFEEASHRASNVLRHEPAELNLPREVRGSTYNVLDTRGDDYRRPLSDHLDRTATPDRPLDALERLEVARLLAACVAGLHAGDLATSGIDASTFTLTLEPRPSLTFTAPHGLRPVGGEPMDGSSPIRTMDDDRHDLAVLIHDVLELDRHDSTHPPLGISARQLELLENLWSQASRPSGGRPTAERWKAALNA